ncbi:receptor expression-enhancing protein 1-like isoform X2 [Dendronephthya gigantea]|uniref:receptor expression-enhancing protein 1-like isoform X2 n=1 Tax=Dendronephthya gigantea TaxID=151771 RepID=UPI00106A3BA4|nr:receptor expression-enhancing protein 1-like isoform X2 [Dendronephthya gigantea]
MVSYIVSRIIVVSLGTLYPAYRSYKAIRSKDTKEYVKWMMYWIVFAIFTTAEIFVDTIVGFWLPFYYEIKVLFLFWILSPTTKGSSILYKKFVHPFFIQHEKDIDSYIEQAKEHGYGKLVQYGKKGLDLAADTMMKTAISGQDVLVQQLRRYRSESSLDGLGEPDPPTERISDEVDARPNGGDQRQKPKDKKTAEPSAATETVRTTQPTTTTQTSRPADSARKSESTNLTTQRTQASSLDDVYMRSSLTGDGSLYNSSSASRRYYDGTDQTLRSRPTSNYYESYADYSTRPYETSNLPSDYTSSSYRYESSTLPRSRDSRRYNTRSGRY